MIYFRACSYLKHCV